MKCCLHLIYFWLPPILYSAHHELRTFFFFLFEDRKRCLFYHFVPSTLIFTSLKMWPAVVADGRFSLFVSKLNSYKS